MRKRTAWAIGGTAAAAAVLGGGGVAIAAGGDDDHEGPDVAITGTALERAGEAALQHLGEGRVTDTEVGDEEGYYEVEVTLDDGTEVDVHLTGDFTVLGEERDEAGADDD